MKGDKNVKEGKFRSNGQARNEGARGIHAMEPRIHTETDR